MSYKSEKEAVDYLERCQLDITEDLEILLPRNQETSFNVDEAVNYLTELFEYQITYV